MEPYSKEPITTVVNLVHRRSAMAMVIIIKATFAMVWGRVTVSIPITVACSIKETGSRTWKMGRELLWQLPTYQLQPFGATTLQANTAKSYTLTVINTKA